MGNEGKIELASTANVETPSRESQLIELWATSAWITGLPIFRGEREEDIQEYIKNFEDQTCGLDDRLKILGIRRSFRGSAKEWLNENCSGELGSSNYSSLKQKIIDRYAGETAYIRNRKHLNQMRFDVNGRETLGSFVDRFVALARRLKMGEDKEIVTGILIALPLEVQGDLEYLESLKNITTLEGLTKLAQRYDGIVSKRFKGPDDINQLGAIVSSISQEELKKALKNIREEFQLQHEEILAAIGSRNQREKMKPDSEERRCYNCQKIGHLARDCSEQKSNRQMRSDDQTTPKQPARRDYNKINQEAREEYERKFGKPASDCPICGGYHFVYHCPLKTLKD